MGSPILSAPTESISTAIQGVWWLQTREDWTKTGERRTDPVLGPDPLGILTYTKSHFAAQFMKRDRTGSSVSKTIQPGVNNTQAVDGYDAYFGTYKVDEAAGKVMHTLIGSISQANVGMSVVRDLRVQEDQLIIQIETNSTEGEPVIRTLTWKKMS